MKRFWSKVSVAGSDQCWLWTGFTKDGYGMFWLGGRPQRASRVSWSLTHGEVPDGLMVLHKCDVRACVNPDHLFLGTHSDNMADMAAKGRAVCPAKTHPECQARGVRSGSARLDDARVRAIREMAAAGTGQREIARRFGVDHKTIAKVVSRETWTHVTEAA